MEPPTERSASAPVVAAARRAVFGLGVRELGVGAIALAALTAVGVWMHRHLGEDEREIAAVRLELAARTDAVMYYHDRFAAVQATAAQLRALSESQTAEPVRAWARERASRFDALVARVNRER